MFTENDFNSITFKDVKIKKLKPMDNEWKNSIREDKWWSSYNDLEKIKELTGVCFSSILYQLREKLLSFGGEEVCLALSDPDYFKMIERGMLFPGKTKSMKGQPCQCHKNSCNLWENNKDVTRICTGYALSDDGMWREHSWLVNLKEDKTPQIIETTTKRVAYYGFIMTYEECVRFSEDNY